MAMLIVDAVIQALQEAKLDAHQAYPGGAMPHITQARLAVNLEKLDYTARSASVAVTVMVPVEQGGGVCEAEAVRAGTVLENMGGIVVQEACRFDAHADAYAIRVLGTFHGAAVMDGWSALSEFTVEVNETVLRNAVSFRAEQAVDETTGAPLGSGVWRFRLEEKFGWGEGPLPAPTDAFSVMVMRSSGMEVYSECSWTSVELEDTATGLRQIRMGIAKSRAFMVVG